MTSHFVCALHAGDQIGRINWQLAMGAHWGLANFEKQVEDALRPLPVEVAPNSEVVKAKQKS